MDKKEKVIYLLMGIGALLVIVGAVMFAATYGLVRVTGWAPLILGVALVCMGIKRWLDK